MTEIELEAENKAIAQEYKELLRISYQTLTAEDKKIIRKAFDVACLLYTSDAADEVSVV
jgi:guanosine-3',5'-bis(diphosphate) 3'-pyrophosphohydrolase